MLENAWSLKSATCQYNMKRKILLYWVLIERQMLEEECHMSIA